MRLVMERSTGAVNRSEAGHGEGDLIVGEFNGSAIGTLVERVTRYTTVVHLDAARTAEQVKTAIIGRFNQLSVHLRLSLTWDKGIGMARHHEITENDVHASVILRAALAMAASLEREHQRSLARVLSKLAGG
jgi:transposase, IS30 family